jgi:S-layer protein (TIGR01567 family)
MKEKFVLTLIMIVMMCASVPGQEHTADYWLTQGDKYYENRAYNVALDCYNKSLELDPKNALAWNDQGNAFYSINKYDESIKAYDKSLELNADAVVWSNKGSALQAQGKYNDSIEAYDRSIKLNPIYSLAWLNKGINLYYLGKYNDSIKALDRAIEIDPESAYWYNKVNALFYGQGKYNTSAADFVEIRGAVAGTVGGASNLVDNSFTWNPQNFAGFFYDIKKDIGNENLKTVLSGDDGRKLSGDAPYGVTYTTTVQQKAYERALWGAFNVIGFQAEQYFAGYLQGTDEATGDNIFYAETTDKNSLSSEQLQKILMNSKDEMTVTSGTPLKLGEGYELAVKSIDVDGNKVYLELSKDGAVVDSKVVSPSKDGATELDKTYFYKNPKVGEQSKLVTIAVHFKNAFRGADQNLASIDGVWQISDIPAEVKADTQYGKMTITGIDATTGVITMNNKDEPITLTKNKDTVLMPGINIKTANNDTLRFYIYRPVSIPTSGGRK